MSLKVEPSKHSTYFEESATLHYEVVGGELPYVWVGDLDGRFLGSIDDVRALRDALTQALRHAKPAGVECG